MLCRHVYKFRINGRTAAKREETMHWLAGFPCPGGEKKEKEQEKKKMKDGKFDPRKTLCRNFLDRIEPGESITRLQRQGIQPEIDKFNCKVSQEVMAMVVQIDLDFA
jgi:hypothetical protein